MRNASELPETLRPYSRSYALEFSDPDLLKRIADGDKDAMRILFERYRIPVYRFAARLTGDVAQAEDIVSEVFMEVWRRADSFAGRSRVSTWLLAIARHKAYSALRGRTRAAADADIASLMIGEMPDPEGAAYRNDRSRALQGCLARLSPAHREVIDLVYYHEKSVEEVAHIVAAPASTIRTRMFYARHRLLELLKLAGVHDTEIC